MPHGSRGVASIGGLVVLAGRGAVGGAVALRACQEAAERDAAQGQGAAVALEFTPADLAYVESQAAVALAAGVRDAAAGAPGDVKAKVAGDVRQIAVREGEAVQAGQMLARIDTADLESKLIERTGALESAKAQLALAEKTRAMNNKLLLNEKFISQNAFDGSRVELQRRAGQREVGGGAGAARAATRSRTPSAIAPLSGIVAKRHVQPGEKVAFDAPIVTVVDLRDLELQALVPAIDVPELAIGMPVELAVDGFGERRFTGRIERINPSTEPGTRALHRLRRHCRTPTPRCGAACSRPAASRSPRARPRRRCRATAVRTEAGQTFVWTIDNGKLVAAHRARSAGATTRTASSRSRPRCRRSCRCSPRASTT